ncbi:MAG: aldehyde dehydrogenase family protein [Ignavibacteria bacterium]
MEVKKFLIGNTYQKSDRIKEIRNPYSQQITSKVYISSENDINKALNYLTSILEHYVTLPSYRKSLLLSQISEAIASRKESLARLITEETGKPITLSRIEVERAIFTFETGSEEARRIEGEFIQLDQLPGSEGKVGIVKRFPIGLILAITPWNFPINLVAHKVSPALASGNVVLLKPSSYSLGCGLAIAEIIKEVCDKMRLDFCPINVVTVGGTEIEKFVADNRVKMVSFTGSPFIGWHIKRSLNTQKVALELGGNAGVIVDEDADLNMAIPKIVVGGFSNAGQSCISVQRVFVHSAIWDKFVEQIIAKTKTVKYGDPFEEETLVGPMITEEEAIRVERWIEEALRVGGSLLTGGSRSSAVLEPTILTNVPQSCNVCSKEVFAPLIVLQRFNRFKEAISFVNNSDFGLQAGVFTNSINNAFYAFDKLEVGGVVINDVPTYRMDSMPYGGTKLSGYGREGIKYAINEMTEQKILVLSK